MKYSGWAGGRAVLLTRCSMPGRAARGETVVDTPPPSVYASSDVGALDPGGPPGN